MPYLFELDIRNVINNWISRTSGIWETRLYGSLQTIFGDLTLRYDLPQITPDAVPSIKVGRDYYYCAESFAEMCNLPFSFYYNNTNFTLKINIGTWVNSLPVGNQHYLGKIIMLGILDGASNHTDYNRADRSTYGGIYYPERIKTLPTLEVKADDLDYGIMGFNDWSITLINNDGELDAKEYEGSLGRLIYVPTGGERSAGKVLAVGSVKDTTGSDEFTVNLTDIKRRLDTSDYCQYMTIKDYPFAATDLVDTDNPKMIPVYFNQHTKVQGICFNTEGDNGSYYHYLICYAPDNAHKLLRIDRVYYMDTDDDDNDIEVPITDYTVIYRDVSRNIAYISIPTATALGDSTDTPMDFYADIFAWSNQDVNEDEWLNGADLIRECVSMFAGYTYNRFNFNLSNWVIERKKVQDQGIHLSLKITDTTKVNDLITSICKSCLLRFQVRADELFDIRLDTANALPKYTVNKYLQFERVPSRSNENMFSWTKTTYGTMEDDRPIYKNTTRKTAIEDNTGVSDCKEDELIISDLSSVKKFSEHVLDRSQTVKQQIELKIPLEDELLEMDVNEALTAPSSRTDSKTAVYDILDFSKNLDDHTATITLRHRYTSTYDDDYVQGIICGDAIAATAISSFTHYI
jgi:hypothetical protein